MGTVGEGEGADRERSTEAYTTTICKTELVGNVLCNTGSSNLGLCDNLEGWAGVGGDICVPIADSCTCMAETNTICCKAIILQLKKIKKNFFCIF